MEPDKQVVMYANLTLIYAGALVAEGTTLSRTQQTAVYSISKAMQHLTQIDAQYTLKRGALDDLGILDDRSLLLSRIVQMHNPIEVATTHCQLVKLVGSTELWSKREVENFKLVESFILLAQQELKAMTSMQIVA